MQITIRSLWCATSMERMKKVTLSLLGVKWDFQSRRDRSLSLFVIDVGFGVFQTRTTGPMGKLICSNTLYIGWMALQSNPRILQT